MPYQEEPTTNPTERAMKELEERFVAWAQTRPDIRAAFVVGSRARTDHPADEWADLDIIVVASNPERYLSKTDWLGKLGNVWLTTPGSNLGQPERFVLFDGALAVDFVPLPTSKAKQIARFVPILRRFPFLLRLVPRGVMRELQLAAGLFGRGFRAILDKDGLAAKLPSLIALAPSPRPPTQAEFLEIINRFWFFADRIARKLRRGELGVALSFHYDLLRGSLLPMMEWHAKATHTWDYDTWHDGHFLEEWADPRAVKGLQSAFPHYDE
jgi:aminoglycoside 6-adenylyltransferase